MEKGDWSNRPKGCSRTISGMHIPVYKIVEIGKMEISCSACAKIDDTDEFRKWLFGDNKIDDSGSRIN